MAFFQLLVAGMAMATRLENSRQVQVIEKEVMRPVAVNISRPAIGSTGVVSRPPAVVPAALPFPAVPPTPLNTPQIVDPRAGRLVNDAREARVAGDMAKAVMKLEEALSRSKDDPVIHYELGLVHEQMGVYDTASAHYEKVFLMGISGAGSLYEAAGTKLREGFQQADAMLGKLSLGRVRIFNNPNHQTGQQVVLTIPVQKSPAEELEADEISVTVAFFNRDKNGDIKQLEDESWVTEQWVTLPFGDWTGGEESLRMHYVIPIQDDKNEHIFGKNSYYGQVVTLAYAGEVMDVQAWPRDLAARIGKAPAALDNWDSLPEFQNELPLDFDPEVPLLPALPEK
jgi:tetratricopeptide (TPR) repeat protein